MPVAKNSRDELLDVSGVAVTKSFVPELQIKRAHRYCVGGLCKAASVCLQESGVIGVDAGAE